MRFYKHAPYSRVHIYCCILHTNNVVHIAFASCHIFRCRDKAKSTINSLLCALAWRWWNQRLCGHWRGGGRGSRRKAKVTGRFFLPQCPLFFVFWFSHYSLCPLFPLSLSDFQVVSVGGGRWGWTRPNSRFLSMFLLLIFSVFPSVSLARRFFYKFNSLALWCTYVQTAKYVVVFFVPLYDWQHPLPVLYRNNMRQTGHLLASNSMYLRLSFSLAAVSLLYVARQESWIPFPKSFRFPYTASWWVLKSGDTIRCHRGHHGHAGPLAAKRCVRE